MQQSMREHGKLCVLRLSAIGDVCHAIALISHIQQVRPDIEITWVIGKVEFQLVKHLTNIRFVVFDKQQGKQAFKAVKSALSAIEFDALFVMQVALRANWLSRQIKAKQRIGFDWARSKELHWLFTNKRIAKQPHCHVLDGFLGFADAIGISAPSNVQWHYPIPESIEQWYNEPSGVAAPLRAHRYVVINASASKAERNWLAERYATVAEYLIEQEWYVVLTGGPAASEQDLARSIISTIATHHREHCYNLVGKTSLCQLAMVLKQAELVIAPDTGPAHITAMFNTPVIGLYAHSNPRRTGPYHALDKTISVYDDCILAQTGKTWRQLPWGKRAKGKDLMHRIQTQTVIQAIDDCLKIT